MKSDVDLDRKFLHDLATPLSLLKLMAKRLVADMESEGSVDKAQITSRLSKILAAVEDMERLHADHRRVLYDREKPEAL